MNLPNAALMLLSVVSFAAPGGAQPVSESPQSQGACRYADRLLDSITRTVATLPHIAGVAGDAAARLASGGRLWLAGDPGFVTEAYYRAGGMMTAKRLTEKDDLADEDVILLASLFPGQEADVALLGRAREAGALVVYFAGENTPGDHRFVQAFADAERDGDLPLISPALATSLWTFTAELVSALTRAGKMPPMFQSVVVPGGRDRNATHKDLQWEPGTPSRVEPITLGRTYLARLANCVRELRAREMGRFAQAGRLAVETERAGKTVWVSLVGHLPPFLFGQEGDPGLFARLDAGREGERVADHVKPGDLVLYIGYYEPFGPWVSSTHELGAGIVTVLSGTPETGASSMGADVNISGHWPYGDALVDVPGYDVRILPPSGVIQAAAYWMLIAATENAAR